MTLKSPVSVHIEQHEASFGDMMNQIRSWLDNNKIEPAEFRSDTPSPGAIALDIRFRNEDEASLFEQEFGLMLAQETKPETHAPGNPAWREEGCETKTPRSKHILVVDDDADVRDVIVAMLRAHGYRVSIALGGESMRALLRDDNRVDAIVLDALMPGEPATSLALHAKELQLPVVVVSGSPKEMEFAIKNNLQLLEKPFRMHELFDALSQAIVSREFGQRPA